MGGNALALLEWRGVDIAVEGMCWHYNGVVVCGWFGWNGSSTTVEGTEPHYHKGMAVALQGRECKPIARVEC